MCKASEYSTLILIDEPIEGNQLKKILSDFLPGPVTVLPTSTPCSGLITDYRPDLVIIDLRPGSHLGLNQLSQLQTFHKEITSIALVPRKAQDPAIKAMLTSDCQPYLTTPLSRDEVQTTVCRALPEEGVLESKRGSGPLLRKEDGFYGIIGNSEVMRDLFCLIARIGEEGESSVLIQGESGVGKELVARALHLCGPRANQLFVPFNCAAVPETLIESELFGYAKGAFTGANHRKNGRFQHANKGTLFLDEIGEMQPKLQVKLLRVLQERVFEPVGSMTPVNVDVRIVAATNSDLGQAVEDGEFRSDLYYRLNVVPLHIPALRERSEDIPFLVDKFSLAFNRGKSKAPKRFSNNALAALQAYSWPGNIRELKNLVQRLYVLHRGPVVRAQDLPSQITRPKLKARVVDHQDQDLEPDQDLAANGLESESKTDFKLRVSEFEDRLILQALVATNGNKKQAAEKLNLKRTTLIEKIKKKRLDKIYSTLQNQQQ
jgi:DNA-binding NtrC family response regulator